MSCSMLAGLTCDEIYKDYAARIFRNVREPGNNVEIERRTAF